MGTLSKKITQKTKLSSLTKRGVDMQSTIVGSAKIASGMLGGNRLARRSAMAVWRKGVKYLMKRGVMTWDGIDIQLIKAYTMHQKMTLRYRLGIR